ncbi:hypothetical protein LJ707_09250 [Mucilaginibacter sp. UR6-1]|uniref:hypothetical protein n=1 Tax=Mucilaginibacter sp. UR6-1 TaxID=1435643 RepID=UPI001E44791B|nr:hypothetical protein [Mucilaginibacter sp. UR6-1]MCC8409116.1 hypothetical protein [Mucilaginibacter sp. UR6-1]
MSTYRKTTLISVDDALAKGRRMLLLPRILMISGLFFFLFPLAMIFMALLEGSAFTINIWLACAGIVLFCFIIFFYLPFLYWSKTTTRWKLWAFDNVDNVHELRIMAVQANLCPAFGTLMDKLQIQSANERERWRELQGRFDFPEVFKDDPNIPFTTNIFYSKVHLTINILFGLLFVAMGSIIAYLAIKNNWQLSLKLIAPLIAIAPLYKIFIAFKRMFKKQPELVLENQGLTTIQTGFLNWDQIFNEKVTRTDQGKRGVKFTLSFQHPGGIVHIDISDLDITKSGLERLIRVYKGRFASGIR